VRLNRWWRFPSALWSAATHVYVDTNGGGKGAGALVEREPVICKEEPDAAALAACKELGASLI